MSACAEYIRRLWRTLRRAGVIYRATNNVLKALQFG